MTDDNADCILVGGGLANSLIALALKRARPSLKIKILDRGEKIGGNHIWSFHSTDFDMAGHDFLRRLIVRTWDGQAVHFPKYSRNLPTHYNSITSERLHDVVMADLGSDAWLCENVVDVSAHSVTLADQRTLTARCVIDARGAIAGANWKAGYQKFLGLEIELEDPCGLTRPILMDATVQQIDGYRFVYTLPFEDRRLLIEDTYYSSTPHVDEAAIEQRIRDYAKAKGWRIARVIRREVGSLPIPLNGSFAELWSQGGGTAAQAGVRAVMFHPTTGYSLPDAVNVAQQLSRLGDLTTQNAANLVRAMAAEAWQSRSFYRMLNRLMFVAAEPDERLAVMQRFYTLPEGLIRRFYACNTTLLDKARILTGKPPVSITRALRCMREPA